MVTTDPSGLVRFLEVIIFSFSFRILRHLATISLDGGDNVVEDET